MNSITQLAKIKQSLKQQIQCGLLTIGQKLPSERELSSLFETTRITIKDALVSLETEGLIYREERRGWYISPPRICYNPLSRCHFHQMIQAQSRDAETRVISISTELAAGEVAKALQVSSIKQVHEIQRLRYIDERAVLFVQNYLIAELFPDILKYNLAQSLTSLYREIYGFETQRSRFEVIPTAAPFHIAKALNLAEGQPVLKICRVNYNQNGTLIDCEFEYWRPNAVMIKIDSQDHLE